MDTFTIMNRLGPFWAIARFIWAFKGLISIVLLAGTFLGYMTSEMIEHRRTMVKNFNATLSEIGAAEATFRNAGELAFKGPSRTGDSITTKQAQSLEQAVRALRSKLIEGLTPNRTIENARDAYVRSLTDLQGRLNLFAPGAEGTERVLEGLILVQPAADAYHESATTFQTSVWTSFWSAF
ncbi:hypothetical protein [Rhodobaculum claviforme]|uniref:hypothetical protein n=1 Tax=Rhodobaculum claviforme TaxID=1549854 RepID=UPI001913C72B|nr:hypothetical protein [Rhodobaculum claviforme]